MVRRSRSTQQTMAFHARLAGYAGLIPFVAPVLVAWLQPDHAEAAIAVQHAYAALILSFLGGIYWGLALAKHSASWFWWSVAPSLWAWPALLLAPIPAALVLAIGFAFMTLLDRAARRRQTIHEWFFRLRLVLSGVAIISLLTGINSLVMI